MVLEFNLEKYLTGGVENIVKGAIKTTLTNPQQSIFMAKYAFSSKEASKKRAQAEENGEHIPPFLIASITSKCTCIVQAAMLVKIRLVLIRHRFAS